MITQKTFEKIQNVCFADICATDEDIASIISPKLFVLHNPSKQGFYIDRLGKMILSVSECVEPEYIARISRLYPSECPYWACPYPVTEFTIYVLEES